MVQVKDVMDTDSILADPGPMLGDRLLFPTLQAVVYANHAAMAPLSTPVVDAMNTVVERVAAFGADVYPSLADQRRSLKIDLAHLFKANPNDFALVDNTTSGVSAVAHCFPWTSGDEIALYRDEFPTNVTPWLRAAELYGFRPRYLEAPLSGPQRLEALGNILKKNPIRLVAVSWVQFQTGFAAPVHEMAALCHRHNAHLFVDGIQACGVLPLEFGEIDFVACGGHKWLMGPEGTGFLFANHKTSPPLKPHLAGWLSHERPVEFLFEGPNRLKLDRPIRSGVDFLERGSCNAAGLAGLGAAIRLLNQIGPPRIFSHITKWHEAVEPILLAIGLQSCRSAHQSERSGILAFHPHPKQQALPLAKALSRAGITVAAPDGYLRLSPHWPNRPDEHQVFSEALSKRSDR